MGYWLHRVVRLVHSPRVRDWCCLPYPGHPKGCPNYGIKDRCPPKSPYITEVLDVDKPIYFVHSDFELCSHVSKMKSKHPDWSDRQLRNVLYWQSRSKKQAIIRARYAQSILGTEVIVPMGESLGVNLYATCWHSGVRLEKINELKVCKHVVLLGYRP